MTITRLVYNLYILFMLSLNLSPIRYVINMILYADSDQSLIVCRCVIVFHAFFFFYVDGRLHYPQTWVSVFTYI